MKQVDTKDVVADKIVIHYSDGTTEEYDQFVGAFGNHDSNDVYTMFANVSADLMIAYLNSIIKAGQNAFTQQMISELVDESVKEATAEME